MQRLTIDNNVRVTLNTGIDALATSIIFNGAVAPYRTPPTPSAGAPGLITLTNSLSDPANVEIITYTGISGNTLTGCLRGREGTTPRTWPAGTHMICSPTRALVDPANVALVDQVSTFTTLQNFRQQRISGGGARFYRLNPFSSTVFDILSNPVIMVDLVGAAGRPESLVDYQFTIPALADWDTVRFTLISYASAPPGKTLRLFNSAYNGGFVFPFGATHFGSSSDTIVQEFVVLGNKVAVPGAATSIASDIFNLAGTSEFS